jgi:pseudaminic acid biosynthesis-associated methylase
MRKATEQETFWHGEFGNEYARRNAGPELVAANVALFAKALGGTRAVESVLELGSNIGLNLHALKVLLPRAELAAVEINDAAADELASTLPEVELHRGSVLEFMPTRSWDLVLCKGVLIHIDPASLPVLYDLMHRCARRYVLLSEYYNPQPVEVSYRGHANKLFKRDFAGELLDRFPDLALLDYGFAYHRDQNFPQDDATWFLLEKR